MRSLWRGKDGQSLSRRGGLQTSTRPCDWRRRPGRRRKCDLSRVIWASRRMSTLSSTLSGENTVLLRSLARSLRAHLDEFALSGRLDLLFNNAGRSVAPVPLEEVSLEDFQSIVGVNLVAVRWH